MSFQVREVGLGSLVSDSRCDSASSNRLIAVNRRNPIMSLRIRPVTTGNQLQSSNSFMEHQTRVLTPAIAHIRYGMQSHGVALKVMKHTAVSIKVSSNRRETG